MNEEFLLAACEGNSALCESFLSQGVDVGLRDLGGATALHTAAFGGHSQTCLVLLNHGAHIDATDGRGSTALHRAALCGHFDTCLTLLRRGADPCIEREDGRTALHAANFNGNERTCLALIAYGANPRCGPKNMAGLSMAQAAARGGFSERLLELLSSGQVADSHAHLSDLARSSKRYETMVAIQAFACQAQLKMLRDCRLAPLVS